MNDRFKFRVWDKENKCLRYPTRYSNFAIVNGTVVKIESYPTANSAYLGKRIAWEFDDAVLMQCTGLKDKNGKLIYEGDILGGIYHGYIEYCKDCKCFQLFVKDYGCLACEDDLHWYELVEAEELNELEVIGNIYENKELLESEG